MAKLKIVAPKITSLSVTIAVPMHKSIITCTSKDISQLEDAFICLGRSSHDNDVDRKDFERCCTILKHASSCNASLEKVMNSVDAYGKSLKFTFTFAKFEDLHRFIEKQNNTTSDTTM